LATENTTKLYKNAAKMQKNIFVAFLIRLILNKLITFNYYLNINCNKTAVCEQS